MKNYIREIRENRDISGEKLAEIVGTSQQQISYLEKGQRKLTWNWMERIAKALNCRPEELVNGLADPSEAKLVERFRGLADGEKKMLLNMLDTFGAGHTKDAPADEDAPDHNGNHNGKRV